MSYLNEDKNFHSLLEKIHEEHGVDLTEYRPKCLGRRIYTRLQATSSGSIAEYIRYLDENPSEYKNLMDAVTINVTEFFRNPEVFHAIEKIVLPELIARKRAEGKTILRIWSAGCASGEETYSFAILLCEYLKEQTNDFRINIYGTDIDKKVLAYAIEGKYPSAALKEVPLHIIQKYFSADGENYVIADKVRLITKFMHHDLVKDKPIEHVDLILCRNVVIYFSRDLTHKIYAAFYQSLHTKGYLILGKVEALWGEVTRYFKAVDNRERIYQKMV